MMIEKDGKDEWKRMEKMNDTFRTSGHKQAGWSSWERQGVYWAVSGKKK